MFLRLEAVFTKQEVAEIRERLSRLSYSEQKKQRVSAGEEVGLMKNNLQTALSHPEARVVAEKISRRLVEHPEFSVFTRPKKVNMILNRYDAGMYYDMHFDAGVMFEASGRATRTDLSFSVFLSEPDEFTGGDFVFRTDLGEHRLREPAGTVIAYWPDTLHAVEPVEEGSRWAAVGWIESYIADPVARLIQYDLSTAMDELAPVLETSVKRKLESVRERLLRRWVET